MCDQLGVIFLQKSSWFHPHGIEFAGCTLWSMIDPDGCKYTQSYINVFDSKQQSDQIHQDHVDWLRNILNTKKENTYPLIIITHYLPSFKTIKSNCDDNKIVNTAFATNLEYLFDLGKQKLIGLICGHSHEPKSIKINDIWLHLNPSGYPGEKMANQMNKNFYVFNIDSE